MSPTPPLRNRLKRLARSFTVWLGVIVLAWPEMSALVGPLVAGLIGDLRGDVAMRVIGIAVILARIKTAYQAGPPR